MTDSVIQSEVLLAPKHPPVIGYSTSRTIYGVRGINIDNKDTPEGGFASGVLGHSHSTDGVIGSTNSKHHAGVAAINNSESGFGVWAKGAVAGHFEGDVEITGNLIIDGANLFQMIIDLTKRVNGLENQIASLQSRP